MKAKKPSFKIEDKVADAPLYLTDNTEEAVATEEKK
jgi:hypothetical protein